MAKSEIVKINTKIAENLTFGFKKMNGTVVDIYARIEDKFVDQYLTRENETIDEAKERLAQQRAEHMNKDTKRIK